MLGRSTRAGAACGCPGEAGRARRHGLVLTGDTASSTASTASARSGGSPTRIDPPPAAVRYPRLVRRGRSRTDGAQQSTWARRCSSSAGTAPEQPLDGRSLVPILRGLAPDWRTAFLIEYWRTPVFPRIARMGYDASDGTPQIHRYGAEGMDSSTTWARSYELETLIRSPGRVTVREALGAELDGSSRGPATGRPHLAGPTAIRCVGPHESAPASAGLAALRSPIGLRPSTRARGPLQHDRLAGLAHQVDAPPRRRQGGR